MEMQNDSQNRIMFMEKGYLEASVWTQSIVESYYALL
jgi:hypothetical protein